MTPPAQTPSTPKEASKQPSSVPKETIRAAVADGKLCVNLCLVAIDSGVVCDRGGPAQAGC